MDYGSMVWKGVLHIPMSAATSSHVVMRGLHCGKCNTTD
jgi:hypothetical protein